MAKFISIVNNCYHVSRTGQLLDPYPRPDFPLYWQGYLSQITAEFFSHSFFVPYPSVIPSFSYGRRKRKE